MVIRHLPLPQSTFREVTFVNRLGEYIARGEYQCAIDLLMQGQQLESAATNILGECLIQSARQLCVAALQTQSDIEHHQQSLKLVEQRHTELDDEIRGFIKLIAALFEVEDEALSSLTTLRLPTTPQKKVELSTSRSNDIVNLTRPLLSTEASDVLPEVDRLPLEVNRLEVYTLGSFQVYCNGVQVENWSSRKGTHIFKYLLFNRERPIHKEVLMEQFWPDSDVEAQRNNLNVAIYGLRQVLRDNDGDFSHILFQNDCYFLNPEIDIWLDAAAFSAHYQAAQKLTKQGNIKAAMSEYAAAEMLYQGAFLPEDTYEDWTEALRQRLQMEYLDTLDYLSRDYFESGDYAACASMCQKIISVESCSEEAHARLMRCYRRQGQVHLALRQYDQCVKMLHTELDIEPSEEVTALYENIRAGVMV